MRPKTCGSQKVRVGEFVAQVFAPCDPCVYNMYAAVCTMCYASDCKMILDVICTFFPECQLEGTAMIMICNVGAVFSRGEKTVPKAQVNTGRNFDSASDM